MDLVKNTSDATYNLESAFQAFNHASLQLSQSYKSLEDRFENLNAQLKESNTQRLKYLSQKELLANKLNSIFMALPSGLVVLDSNGKIIEYNEQALNLLEANIKNKKWSDVIGSLCSENYVETGEVKFNNGKFFNISSSPYNGGKIILLTDVTQYKSLQSALAHRDRLSVIGEMMAGLAHQIRTPLASAFLHVSNIKQEGINEQLRNKWCHSLIRCLKNLESTMNDLLIYARGDDLAIEGENLSEFIEKLKFSVENEIESNNASLNIFCEEDGDRSVFVNSYTLVIAIQNIIVNAIQANNSNSIVNVYFEFDSNENLIITLDDNGGGIAIEDRANIFQPFYTTKANGTGLGLAVVDTIIKLHEGIILVENNSYGGARFIIQLPMKNKDKLLKS